MKILKNHFVTLRYIQKRFIMKPIQTSILTRKVVFFHLLLVLSPLTFYGQYYQSPEAKQIINLDLRIDNLMFERKMNHLEQDEINSFVSQAAKWFEDYTNIQSEIQQAHDGQSRDYTMNKVQFERKLQQLEQQRISTYNLNGGISIQNKFYKSIDALQQAYSQKGKEIITLVNNDEKISNEIRSANIERDQLMAQLEKGDLIHNKSESEVWRQSLESKANLLTETINRDSDLINDANYICEVTRAESPLKCIKKDLYIAVFTEAFIKICYDSNKPYNKNELINAIKNVGQNSKAVKELRRRHLQQLINERQSIYNQLNKERISLDPSGCWIIGFGKGTQPVIEITENANGEFVGIVTTTGTIHKNYQGRALFILTRINTTTFEGTEYAYTDKGYVKARIPVRIIINKNRTSIEYLTVDNILTLRPC